jgi:WD40 repeat protein
VETLVCKCILDAQEPVAGLRWEACRPVLHVFQKAGREVLIDVPHDSVCGGREITALEGSEQLEWSPCCRYGAITRDGCLAVWNSEKNKLVPSPPSSGAIERMAWRPNPQDSEGELWLAGPMGLAVWSAEGNYRIACKDSSSETTALAWDPTGTYLARACKRGGVHVWNPRTNQQARLERDGDYPIREFGWNSRGALLAGAATNSLFVWSIAAALHGKPQARFVRRLNAPVSRLAYRPGSNMLAVGRIDGGLELLRAVGNGEASKCAQLDCAVSHVAWSPHGKHVAVATSLGQIHAMRVCT